MKKTEKIGIIIVIILVIVMVSGKKDNEKKVSIDCNIACHEIGSLGWVFPGSGPINQNTYLTKDICVSACQARFNK